MQLKTVLYCSVALLTGACYLSCNISCYKLTLTGEFLIINTQHSLYFIYGGFFVCLWCEFIFGFTAYVA